MTVVVNGHKFPVEPGITILGLLAELRLSPVQVAVERNLELVTQAEFASTRLTADDRVEVVTLVGGGEESPAERDVGLAVGGHRFRSRLLVGTGKYPSHVSMAECLAASGAEVVTVAVRRERLFDGQNRSLLDYIDLNRYVILPNTAGCFSAEDAVRVARLGRELLANLGNPGADWVKLEVLGDKKTLLPDPLATVEATKVLVKDGFRVLTYTSDDPITARRLKEVGAACVMPAGSPIGSGQGVLNPNNIRICLEYLKDRDPNYPVIIDAGVGTASDVSFAMELGCDGVLLNTAIASAKNPLGMARAMRLACEAGRLAYLSGRIPKKLYATASSPDAGVIAPAQ
jgi:thiazole synthase